MDAHKFFRKSVENADQPSLNHIGGHPYLPRVIVLPRCDYCHVEMTFFFQFMFPNGHVWNGKIISLFCCTFCEPQGKGTPALPSNIKHPPDGFLDEGQKNFSIIISDFPGDYRKESNFHIQQENITFKKLRTRQTFLSHIGGDPKWGGLGDDTPVSYMGKSFSFLLQIERGWNLYTAEGAPEQYVFPWFGNAYPHPGIYEIFYGLPLYFFGVDTEEGPKVYIINQK